MKAMILAAGFGSRLGELTRHQPKCLLEVGGKTLLEHVLTRLKTIGVNELVINLHHCSEQVISFLKEHNNFGIAITLSLEEELLDTGGGLQRVADFFKQEPYFIVHNCDVFSEIDLLQLVRRHLEEGAAASLAVQKRAASRSLLFDENMELCGWQNSRSNKRKVVREVKEMLPFAFCGIQVLSPEVFNYSPSGKEVFSIIESYLNGVERGARILGVDISPAFWIDVGTPERVEMLRKRLEGNPRNKPPSAQSTQR